MVRFVLLAARRSGTTLFVDCVNKHPRIECEKRAFGMERRIKNPTPDNHSGRFFLYRTASLSRRLRFYTSRTGLIREFVNGELFRSAEPGDILGFRLTYDQAEQYPQVLEALRDTGARVVHLVRQNALKTYVSELTARLHRMHHPRKGASIRTEKVRLDTSTLPAELERRVGRIESMRRAVQGMSCLEVHYEALSRNRDAEIARATEFLGADAPPEQTSDLVKINPDRLAPIVENYDEVVAVLRDTPYARFLD